MKDVRHSRGGGNPAKPAQANPRSHQERSRFRGPWRAPSLSQVTVKPEQQRVPATVAFPSALKNLARSCAGAVTCGMARELPKAAPAQVPGSEASPRAMGYSLTRFVWIPASARMTMQP